MYSVGLVFSILGRVSHPRLSRLTSSLGHARFRARYSFGSGLVSSAFPLSGTRSVPLNACSPKFSPGRPLISLSRSPSLLPALLLVRPSSSFFFEVFLSLPSTSSYPFVVSPALSAFSVSSFSSSCVVAFSVSAARVTLFFLLLCFLTVWDLPLVSDSSLFLLRIRLVHRK